MPQNPYGGTSGTYRRREEAGGTSTVKGEAAPGGGPDYDKITQQKDEDEYAKQQGATGIAGTAKRSKPEYKTGLAAFLAAQKLKRQATAAQRTSEISGAANKFKRTQDMSSDEMIEEAARGYGRR